LELAQKDNLADNLPLAYEGMARAYAIAKENRFTREYINMACEALKAAKMSAEDKKKYNRTRLTKLS
jgi:hypothetical protein